MHIVVCMKQVVDLEQVRIRQPSGEAVLDGVPLLLGAFDKNALEEAVRIKEQHSARVTALSVGGRRLAETIKEALAIGADEAAIVEDAELDGSDAAGSALALAAAVKKLGPVDLILTGEGSADDYSGQMPSRLAELLGLPQVTYVRQLEVADGRLRAVRDLEDELLVVEAPMPAVVSVTGEINQPRLPPLSAILRAGRKPLHRWTLADIGIDAAEVGRSASGVRLLTNLAPQQQRKGIVYEDPPEVAARKLADSLAREGLLK